MAKQAYSKTLMKKWNPRPGTAAEKIGQLIEKGKTVAQVIEMTKFPRNTVVARFSDYRRINGLAWTGKILDKDGHKIDKPKAVKREPKKKPGNAKKNSTVKMVKGIPVKTTVKKAKPVGKSVKKKVKAASEKSEPKKQPKYTTRKRGDRTEHLTDGKVQGVTFPVPADREEKKENVVYEDGSSLEDILNDNDTTENGLDNDGSEEKPLM